MFTYVRIYKKEITRVRKEEFSSIPLWKYFFRWKKALNPQHTSMSDRQPWVSFLVIDFLTAVLQPGMKVFEYGGGGSTLFFLDRVSEVTTVEHDKAWFQALQDTILKSPHKDHWKGLFVEAEPGTSQDTLNASDPDLYLSTEKQYAGMKFRNYASSIDQKADASLDMVLVDGRSRPSCIKHGIPKIKKGGYLVLDNSDRNYYLEFFRESLKRDFTVIIDQSGPTPYSSWFNRTSVWQKK